MKKGSFEPDPTEALSRELLPKYGVYVNERAFRLLRIVPFAANKSWIIRKQEEVGYGSPALAATLPSEAEAGLAKQTSRVLASRLKKGTAMKWRTLEDGEGQGTVKLPAPAVALLLRILEEMARGNAVTIIPVHAELTTQEAADILNISRPSLIQLLEEGKIEYRRVVTHRRVRFEALMKYKRHVDEERRAALEELAAYDQELGI